MILSLLHSLSHSPFQCIQENLILKQQLEVLLRDNIILKRAVAIQRERQKEIDKKNEEVRQLKLLLSQCQELLRTLEVILHSYLLVDEGSNFLNLSSIIPS